MAVKRVDASAYIKHMTSELRVWLDSNVEYELRKLTAFKQTLESPDSSFDVLRRGSLALRSAANYYGTYGELKVLDGDETGWVDVGRSLHYKYWALRINVKVSVNTQFLRDGRPWGLSIGEMDLVSNLLCAALIVRADNMRAKLRYSVWFLEQTQAQDYTEHMRSRVFEPFALWLSQPAPDTAVRPESSAEVNVYQTVVDAWREPAAIEAALLAVCDYHCTHMSYTKKRAKNDWELEFSVAPFELLPVDVLAIYAVRDRLGLQTPWVDHPLMNLPLARPDRIAFHEDDVTLRVADLFVDAFGES